MQFGMLIDNMKVYSIYSVLYFFVEKMDFIDIFQNNVLEKFRGRKLKNPKIQDSHFVDLPFHS